MLKAAAEGCRDIVELLLRKGADIHQTEPKNKFNALLKAIQYEQSDIVKLLLDYGADPNSSDKFGVTALMYACQKGQENNVELLIESGAEVNAQSLIKKSALLYALEYNYPEIATYLFENGADINQADIYNQSALLFAANYGYTALVEDLVEMGADINLKTKDDLTAAVIAQQHEYDDIVQFLLESGADSTGLVFTDSTETEADSLMADLFDTPPEPIGGISAVLKRLRYPKKAKEAGLHGTVKVNVLVDKRGRVKETEILESFEDEDCEKAAIRAIRNTRWKSAKKGRKSVEAWAEIPIEFTLNDE